MSSAHVHIEGIDDPVRWLDAKQHFIDSAFTHDLQIQKIGEQFTKYLRNYGKGQVIWGKPYSDEWDETAPNLFHANLPPQF